MVTVMAMKKKKKPEEEPEEDDDDDEEEEEPQPRQPSQLHVGMMFGCSGTISDLVQRGHAHGRPGSP